MKNSTTISIDLAKTVLQVALFNKYGVMKSNNKMSQAKMVQLIAQSLFILNGLLCQRSPYTCLTYFSQQFFAHY
ncbi:MAG: hypothetical protein GY775_11430 [Candidatus Scalindua sp.]|nr:hypothetical protein [Candidatus Scalindua sp.]